MEKEHLRTAFCITIGLCGAAATEVWPNHAAAAEMAVYSAVTLGTVFFGLWSDHHRSRFLPGILAVFLFHGVFLYLIRSLFPFSAILVVIPIAFFEVIILLAIILKILETGGADFDSPDGQL
jgi:hypothetical protein